MKANLISKDNKEAKFTVEFSAEEFENAQIEAYKQTKDKFKIDGFRPGKAPRTLIEKHYGESIFFEDALDNLLQNNYGKALNDLEIEIIDRPAMEFSQLKKGDGFTVTFTVKIFPEVEVKNYKGLKAEKVETKIDDAKVDEELARIQKRNARSISVDRAAKDGDTVILDYAGFVGDKQFDGGTAEKQSLQLGSGTFIPGFEDQLIGVKPGEDKDVKVTFPEEYHEPTLAGKEAVFKCKVHEVQEEELPKLDDEFAKDVSEFDTLDEYKADLKKNMEQSAMDNDLRIMEDYVLQALNDANEVEVPEVMVEDEIDEMLNNMAQQLSYSGLSLQQYAEYVGGMEALRAGAKVDAERTVKTRILLNSVAKAEKMEVLDEDLNEEYDKMAKQFNMEVAKVKEYFEGNDMTALKKDILMRKASKFVLDNAKFAAKKAAKKTEKTEKPEEKEDK